MKQTIYILTIALGLWSCNNNTNDHSGNKSIDTLGRDVQQDTENVLVSQAKQPTINKTEIETSKDSVVFFSYSLFSDLNSESIEISKNLYELYWKNCKCTCSIDSNGFIKGKGLIFSHDCNEICQSFLTDNKDGVKLILPSDYDAGIIGLDISPSCNQFIVYSSYDGPDYTEYYNYRAEVFGFSISQGQGLKAIKPSFKFYTTDWSIEEVIWISDVEIAFKTYAESRTTKNQDNLNYKYFKTKLNK